MKILNLYANGFKYHVSNTDGKISVRIKIEIIFIFRLHRCSIQLDMLDSSSADEGHSAGWKLPHFIYFHRYLRTPAMSTDNSQVGVALFPSC